jgi:cation transporter-like permease
MAFHESALSRSWRDTEGTRGSLVWWIGAVITGATLAVAGYYVAPGGSLVLFAVAGVVIGFFAPYVLAVAWGLARASVRQRDEARMEIDKLAGRGS